MQIINDIKLYEPFANEELKSMKCMDGMVIVNRNLLGEMSAQNEWQHPNKARSNFIHLSAYEHFVNEDQLLLLGRTGSGKSAIIYSLKDDIEKNKINRYTDVIRIDEQDFCEKLAELCYDIDIDRFDATNKIKKAIVITLYTQVMIHCLKKYDSEYNDFKHILKYLISKNFIIINNKEGTNFFDLLKSDNFEEQIDSLNNNKISGALSVSRILLSMLESLKKSNSNSEENEILFLDENNYEKALNELVAFLNKKNIRILVLMDSFDEYKINDKAFVVAIKSLILACFDVYAHSNERLVYFKMALASEIYTRVLNYLPARNHANTVVIQWSFRELIKCMALRFVSWFHDKEAKHADKHYLFNFLHNFSVSDFKDSKRAYNLSEKIFYNILPKICKTNSSYTYLTLSFISRHTMKKPREILQIFNAILDIIIDEDNPKYFLNDDGSYKIKDVVHSLQNSFIDQTLSLYRLFIPNIDSYINTLLNGQIFIFSISEDIEFENRLKKVNARIQSDVNSNAYLSYYNGFDIFNVILETGLLGVVSEVRIIETKNIEQFGSNETIKIIDALFEYQIKGKIQKNDNVQYVIHPMCYEHFGCFVGMRSMVNTDSYDKTELLASVISAE